MTVKELTDWLIENAPDDMPVRVVAFGGLGRRGKDIESASVGFDWDSGSILLHPKPALEIYRSASQRREDERKKREILDSIGKPKAKE